MMKNSLIIIVIFFCSSLNAQIIVNGHNPARKENGKTSVTLSYGNVFWVDGNNKSLSGYSYPAAVFHDPFFNTSIGESWNSTNGISLGVEKWFSDKLGAHVSAFTGKMINGIGIRGDLITHDKSSFSQVNFHGLYNLTKNSDHRFQFQWLLGPEISYAHKDVLIEEYMENDTATPENYRQDIKIVEGALVTGLGITFRLSDSFSLFSNGGVGISLPGKGLKVTSSGIGLKYSFP